MKHTEEHVKTVVVIYTVNGVGKGAGVGVRVMVANSVGVHLPSTDPITTTPKTLRICESIIANIFRL
jgi:hypothetical protein